MWWRGEKEEDIGNNDAENMREGDIANMKVLRLVPYQFKTMFVWVCVCMCACVFAYVCAWLCLYACMNACTQAFVAFSRMFFLPCYFVYLLLSFHMKDEIFRSWETSCSFKKRLTIEARDSSDNWTRVCCDLCKLSCECKLESTSTML